MATTTYIGTGEVTSADFREVTWTGKTKSNKPVIIKLHNAMNMSNIDLTMADKDDVVPSVEFQACYNNTNQASTSTIEPWEIITDDATTAGANEILLDAGVFAIDGTDVGLTRGGGKFTVERTYREISADGDRGAVKDRVVLTESRAKLSMNTLTWLTKITNLYPAVAASV